MIRRPPLRDVPRSLRRHSRGAFRSGGHRPSTSGTLRPDVEPLPVRLEARAGDQWRDLGITPRPARWRGQTQAYLGDGQPAEQLRLVAVGPCRLVQVEVH